MATVLQMCATPSADCGGIYIFDQTGAYDASSNPGGHGAPNLAIADVTSAVLLVTYAGATTAVSVNVIANLPTVDDAAAFFLEPDDVGLTEFPQGIMRITYSIGGMVAGSPVSYSTSVQIAIDCDYKCSAKNELAEAAQAIADGCRCDNDAVLNSIFLSIMPDAGAAAVCCGNVTEANTIYSFLETQFGASSGGCGCS